MVGTNMKHCPPVGQYLNISCLSGSPSGSYEIFVTPLNKGRIDSMQKMWGYGFNANFSHVYGAK